MSTIFDNARLKVQGANHQIDEIIRHSAALPRSHWKFEFGEIHGFPGDGYIVFTDLSYVPTQPIPEFFADFAGLATYQFRSAMNNSIVSAVNHLLPDVDIKSARLDMPFGSDAQDLNSRHSYRFIREALPNLADVIVDEIQPYRTGNELLWSIAKSQNTDKYDGFIPTVTVSRIPVNCRTVYGGNIFSNCAVSGDANKKIGILGGGPFIMHDKVHPAVDVRFSPDSFFGDEPVIEALLNGSKVVTESINALERFVQANAA